MENKEMDKWLAEKVMGWHKLSSQDICVWLDENDVYMTTCAGWHPTENIEQAYQCEDMMPVGKVASYLGYLMEECTGSEDWDGVSWGNMFDVIHASPYERCQAIYNALKER